MPANLNTLLKILGMTGSSSYGEVLDTVKAANALLRSSSVSSVGIIRGYRQGVTL